MLFFFFIVGSEAQLGVIHSGVTTVEWRSSLGGLGEVVVRLVLAVEGVLGGWCVGESGASCGVRVLCLLLLLVVVVVPVVAGRG